MSTKIENLPIFLTTGVISAMYYLLPFISDKMNIDLWCIYEIRILGFSASLYAFLEMFSYGTFIPFICLFFMFLLNWLLLYKIAQWVFIKLLCPMKQTEQHGP